MKWKHLSKNESHSIMESWTEVEEPSGLNRDYRNLREDLITAFEEALLNADIENGKIKGNEYKTDLHFGLALYDLLNDKYKFNIRMASTDGIWRYLSIAVIPDIVGKRWGLNPGRFWRESRRMWLKALWWYIHLSWQGSTEATLEVVKGNTTDEIVQLVERSGSDGYRVELYRQIMRYYGSLAAEQKARNSELFRKVMKLNTARIKVVEPDLVSGGVQVYVKELFEYFEQREIASHH